MSTRRGKSLKVLSCVPRQLYTFTDKFEWTEEQIKKYKPDVIVLPQEGHGGIQTIFFADQIAQAVQKHRRKRPEKVSYDPAEIIDPYTALSKKYDVGIAVGALIDCPIERQRRERIYLIDPDTGSVGYADKMTLPGYDHINAHGKTKVYPETNLENRAQAFPLCGARVSILFCWEVYSSYIWHAISRAQPDFVVSMIKFGVQGWPQKAKVGGESVVTGFGFGADGGWVERLRMASKWDLAAPIICSTNSWNLPCRAGALAGQILPWEEKETKGEWARAARKDTLWQSSGKGNLTDDYVQVDEVDYLYWRYIRDHKFALNGATGEWPSSEARAMTMAWKIRRMERQFSGLPKLAAASVQRGGLPLVGSGQGLLAALVEKAS